MDEKTVGKTLLKDSVYRVVLRDQMGYTIRQKLDHALTAAEKKTLSRFGLAVIVNQKIK